MNIGQERVYMWKGRRGKHHRDAHCKNLDKVANLWQIMIQESS
jgi:hypothetical protein